MTPDEISESVKMLREQCGAAGMHTLPEIKTINALVDLVAEMTPYFKNAIIATGELRYADEYHAQIFTRLVQTLTKAAPMPLLAKGTDYD